MSGRHPPEDYRVGLPAETHPCQTVGKGDANLVFGGSPRPFLRDAASDPLFHQTPPIMLE